jgi:basic amino acid/polyamine antiporter, APA family
MTTGPGTEPQLARSIGLAGSIALVVGGVIGAGIFVQVKPIAAQSGNAIWLAFVLAILVSMIGVIPLIQLAGALPRAGAGYLFSSRLLSPFLGVITSYWLILGGGASTSVVALTLARYLPVGLPDHAVAILILLLFYIVYQAGMRLAISLQVLMAIQFVVALVVYGLVGAFTVELSAGWRPPLGPGPFIEAILLCYSTCMGFQVIGEMGEEIRNARRTIPLALLIGGAIVASIYILVGLVFVNTQSLHQPAEFAAFSQPLTQSATPFLGGGWIRFLAIGAITAGLTSLNAAAIALPRELFAQARDGFLPALLGQISPRTHTPQHAVTVYFLFVILLLLAGGGIEFYGLMAAIGVSTITTALCIASIRLPHIYPERYAYAYIRFPKALLWLCTVLTLLVSLVFIVALVSQRPGVLLVYVLWTLLVMALYYRATRKWQTPDWARLRAIPGQDE